MHFHGQIHIYQIFALIIINFYEIQSQLTALDYTDDTFQYDCLDYHNKLRVRHCVASIEINEKLIELSKERARKYAESNGSVYNHTENEVLESAQMPHGENIDWYRGTNDPTCRHAIDAWYNENVNYNYETGDASKSGHFTQIVWMNTAYVGCALVKNTRSNGGYFVVCSYSPYGNTVEEYKNNVIKPTECDPSYVPPSKKPEEAAGEKDSKLKFGIPFTPNTLTGKFRGRSKLSEPKTRVKSKESKKRVYPEEPENQEKPEEPEILEPEKLEKSERERKEFEKRERKREREIREKSEREKDENKEKHEHEKLNKLKVKNKFGPDKCGDDKTQCKLIELENFNNDCLKAHNDYRSKHDVPMLQTNKKLINVAKRRAIDSAGHNKKITHMDTAEFPYGENLHQMEVSEGDAIEIECKDATEAFYIENLNYDYESGQKKDPEKPINHFTQIVWKNTKHLGCASAMYTGNEPTKKTIVVCLYEDPGNYEGEYTANVPPPK